MKPLFRTLEVKIIAIVSDGVLRVFV